MKLKISIIYMVLFFILSNFKIAQGQQFTNEESIISLTAFRNKIDSLTNVLTERIRNDSLAKNSYIDMQKELERLKNWVDNSVISLTLTSEKNRELISKINKNLYRASFDSQVDTLNLFLLTAPPFPFDFLSDSVISQITKKRTQKKLKDTYELLTELKKNNSCFEIIMLPISNMEKYGIEFQEPTNRRTREDNLSVYLKIAEILPKDIESLINRPTTSIIDSTVLYFNLGKTEIRNREVLNNYLAKNLDTVITHYLNDAKYKRVKITITCIGYADATGNPDIQQRIQRNNEISLERSRVVEAYIRNYVISKPILSNLDFQFYVSGKGESFPPGYPNDGKVNIDDYRRRVCFLRIDVLPNISDN